MRRRIALLLAAVMLVALAGCSVAVQPAESGETQDEVSSMSKPQSANSAELAAPETLPDSVYRFAAGTGAALMAGDENACYSPLSAYMALALVATGADEATLAEMAAVMALPEGTTVDALADEMGRIMETLPFEAEPLEVTEEAESDPMVIGGDIVLDGGTPRTLAMANSAWLDDECSYLPDFEALAKERFHADTFQSDMSSPETGQAMGRWISDNTGGLLSPELTTDEDNAAALYLINTVYLADAWIDAFSPGDNTDEPFVLPGGDEVETEFMNAYFSRQNYIKGEDYLAFSMGLEGGGAMSFILPEAGAELDALLKDEAWLHGALSGQGGSEELAHLDIKLPKFTFDSDFDMGETLQGLGMERAFTESAVPFPGLAEVPAPGQGLYIGEIIQQTHIGLDEEGVEAAAATIIAMPVAGAAPPEEIPTVEIHLTRPFLFCIQYGGLPLFIGVVANPAA